MPGVPALENLLLFMIGDQSFCLPAAHVREIHAWAQPTPLPGSDAAVLGVINLRGTVLPVIDPAIRLGLAAPAAPAARPVFIIAEFAGRQAGLRADRVCDILTIPSAAIGPPPALIGSLAPGSVAAIAPHEGQLLRILAPEHLLAVPGETARGDPTPATAPAFDTAAHVR